MDIEVELVEFLTWYIHESELNKDTYPIEFIVKEYLYGKQSVYENRDIL